MQTSQPDGPVPDLYRLLGVARDSSRAEIMHAYRRRARNVHPDSRPQDASAPARFRALAEAYQVLSDPSRRAAYDRALAPRPARGPGGPAGPVGRPIGPAPGSPLWAGPVRVDPLVAGPARDVPREGYAQADERDVLALFAELAGRYLDDLWYPPW